MDEPLSNLGAELRAQTRKEIVDLHRRAGVSTPEGVWGDGVLLPRA